LDTEKSTLTHQQSGRVFPLKDLGAAFEIISAGGLFAYARRQGLVAK